MTNPPDWPALRALFPILERKTYLNSGSYAALARPVEAAAQAYLACRNEQGAAWDQWVTRHEAVRGLVARLIGASADEVAITTSASAGINALASSFDFSGPRDTVVITDHEFPTHAQIWYAQERRGARVLRAMPDASGQVTPAAIAALVDDRTALVAATQVCYLNGRRLDIPAITDLAHARGARVLVDAYQGLGARHWDVADTPVDFIAGGMLKYLLGTAGIGLLYARAGAMADLVPTATGWFAQADIGAMDSTRYDPAPNARRFEAGTPPVPSSYMAEAGLELLLSVGTRAIEPRIEALSGQCIDRLAQIGWPATTPRDNHLRGPTVAIPSRDPAGLVAALGARGIVTSSRAGNIRASFHFYNDASDIEALIAALMDLKGEYAP